MAATVDKAVDGALGHTPGPGKSGRDGDYCGAAGLSWYYGGPRVEFEYMPWSEHAISFSCRAASAPSGEPTA